MSALSASNTGKSIMKDTTIEIAIDHLFHIGAEETVLFGKMLVINLLKSVKIIFNTLIIL